MNTNINADNRLCVDHGNLNLLPSKPGVYLMKDSTGMIIYIGKAADLKKRISSYFTSTFKMDTKTKMVVRKINAIETILTGSEKEALLLESNLIKKHKPRYNVVFKDDKRYPSLRFKVKEKFPRLEIVRKVKNDGAIYFGPYSSAQAVKQTMGVINKTFKLRKCKSKTFALRSRPCLYYQMQRCYAPCCLTVDKILYQKTVKEVIQFLKGRTPGLLKKFKEEMLKAADVQNFESAAALRDKIYALEKTLEKQVTVTNDFKDRDIIAIARSDVKSIISVFFVRGGFLLGTRHFKFISTLSTDSELIEIFIRQYYEDTPFIPKEILVPIQMKDTVLIEDWLGNQKGKKVKIIWPQRGEKKRIIKMAAQNAEKELKNIISVHEANLKLLLRLKKRLILDKVPYRIECFDNSNILGREPVAGMVVFKNGEPKKSSYRRYKIKSVYEQDDYAYMREVLSRRYNAAKRNLAYPDLLIVDGGKGQVGVASSVAKDLGIEGKFDIIGIAKKKPRKGETSDKVYKPGRRNPINFGKKDDLLLFVQRVRDEAHRVAINFHRNRYLKDSTRSELDKIPMVGQKRKVILLKRFGSIKKIKEATAEELSAIPGMNYKVAENIRSYFKDV